MAVDFRGFCPDTRILVILLEQGRVKVGDFQRKYGVSHRPAVAALERLESLGLTAYMPTGDRYETVYWALTEKGVKVAESLKDIDEYIRNG